MKESLKSWLNSFTLLSFGQKAGVYWLVVLTLVAVFLPWWSSIDPNIHSLDKAYLPPLADHTHLLGTDQLGRDLLYLLLYGTRTAWQLTFPPLLFATLIGLCLGSLAAIQGNKGIQSTWAMLLGSVLGFTTLSYILHIAHWWELPNLFIHISSNAGKVLSVVICIMLVYVVGKLLSIVPPLQRTISFPFDELLQKSMDMWTTLPKLLLLLLLTTFSTPSLNTLAIWISLSYWVFPARLARARVLQLKQETFVEAAKTLGVPSAQIITRHIWPSLTGPIITNFCFTASGLLGVGSTLAYLGIGIPADIPTWGKLLATSRYNLEAWWLYTFPAIVLLISIFSLQAIGQAYLKRR